MDAPIEINHFPPLKTDVKSQLTDSEMSIESGYIVSPEKTSYKDKDEVDSSKLENTDSESNVVYIQSSEESPMKRNTIKDFQISYVIGKGSYAKVVLATNIYTNKQYALKIIDKLFLGKVIKQLTF